MNEFHLLRPWWLLALAPLGVLAWPLLRIGDPARSWQGLVAPHLLQHLLVGQSKRTRLSPINLLIASWLCTVVALAGPTWAREPSPFADDQAVLAIVLKVTPSMMTEDIQLHRWHEPSKRSTTCLPCGPARSPIAYSGSAHQVMPLTADAGIIDSFAGELAPNVMPKVGDAAGTTR